MACLKQPGFGVFSRFFESSSLLMVCSSCRVSYLFCKCTVGSVLLKIAHLLHLYLFNRVETCSHWHCLCGLLHECLYLVCCLSFLLHCQVVCRTEAYSTESESLHFIPCMIYTSPDLVMLFLPLVFVASFLGITLKSRIFILCALTTHGMTCAYRGSKSLDWNGWFIPNLYTSTCFTQWQSRHFCKVEDF